MGKPPIDTKEKISMSFKSVSLTRNGTFLELQFESVSPAMRYVFHGSWTGKSTKRTAILAAFFFSSETFIDMFHFIGLPTREIEIFIDFRMQFYSVLPSFFHFSPNFSIFPRVFP